MASSVMARPEEARIHSLAVRAAPDAIKNLYEHLAKPQNMVVAIERHNCDWRDGRKHVREHFLWVKAKYKHTVAQIKKSYCDHYKDSAVRPTLSINGDTPDDKTTLGNLNFHNDEYVVFTTQAPTSAAPTSDLTSTPPSASRFHRDLHTSTPKSSTRDTSLATSKAFPFDPSQGAMSHKGESLNDLAPIAGDKALFMPRNDQGDTPDPPGGGDMEYSNADFPMHEQDSLPEPGTSASLAIGRLLDAMPDQGSQTDRNSPRTPVKANEQHSSSSAYVPRMIPNPFGVDELAESLTTSVQKPLQSLLQEPLPERPEAAVVKGVTVLSEIQNLLHTVQQDPDAQQWLQQIEMVRDVDKSSRAVIGVVGNTGAGKSSVINALLDEERLVPTNCMRACTAVVTEISYNKTDNKSAKYRAEIEFIQPKDWQRELAVLFEEVFDGQGLRKDANNPDSVAGVAYAKIRAVYPKHTKDMLQNSTIEQLMNLPSVNNILGTVKRIQSRDCKKFYQRMQHYVDSQQKLNVTKGAKPVREPQLWPLIKVVRIYTKAEALSTGAVIVDLPGVQDSNAARAAVAESYIKECTGLWIVAPITRAVDDKAAKNLLGTTFKRQLKYDGSYSAVTFICSKTDDISRTEAADALQLGDIVAEQEAERESIELQKRAAVNDKKSAKADKEAQDDLVEHHDEQIAYWEDILSKIENGESITAVIAPTNKRKRTIDHESTETSDDKPSTPEQVQSKLDEHKRSWRDARKQGAKLRDEIARLQEIINGLEKRKAQVDQEAEALCIKGRNDWSRARICEDFAEGIKELDQENAAEENPGEFDPDEELRDYGEASRALPVFCVSSRAYQKLSGRLQKDGGVNGFTSLSQTEIPQLQAHCRKLTEAGRLQDCKVFLNSLSRLLTSLSLWASDDGSSPESSTQQRKMMQVFVTKNLQTLKDQLEEAVHQTMEDVEQSLETQLFDHLAAAAKRAAKKAVQTSDVWGAPRDEGGLFWATYKATVRRYGVFHGASGERDFNKELSAPMIKNLMKCWEKTFQRRLPEIFDNFPTIANTIIGNFHDAVKQRCESESLGVSRIARLNENIDVLKSAFNDLGKQTIFNVNEAQREINREFTPSVTQAMAPTYERSAQENGLGSFRRMKEIMHDDISANQNVMFQNTTVEVRNQLDLMCKQSRITLTGRVQRLYEAIARDYKAVIGTEAGRDRVASKPEKLARKKLEDVILQSGAVFSEVLECDVKQLESVMVGVSRRVVVEVEPEADVEDATQPLIELSSDGVDEDDDMA
ncbi:hypothetical protein Q7P35_003933 [Cladosporium inversicolor]